MTGSEYVELTEADLRERWRRRDPLDYIDEVARQVDEEYATPDSALRWLLKLAWSDLRDARRSVIGGQWSINCEHVVSRIAGLTRLVGPLDWGEVPVGLIVDGWYERIHEAVGTPTPLAAEDRARAREVLNRRR